ncbi:MAG TPA: DUF5677 domain-containing protein [Terriglobales bacterium]
MSAVATLDPLQITDRFYTMVKSLSEFDKMEVRGVIRTLLSTSDRERCFIGTYHRTTANTATLLELRQPKHFQAVAMLARGLFELAVDIRLIDVIPDGPRKTLEFTDAEKLRCARKVLRFKAANSAAKVDTTVYNSFVANNENRIDTTKSMLWPTTKNVSHWSGLKLASRVALVKSPFEEIYEVHYPQLSWYVHSGLTGIANLKAETFTLVCGRAFKLAADAYWEVLMTMIREFKIAKANGKIEGKLKAAKLLPFTDTPEEADQLLRALTQ